MKLAFYVAKYGLKSGHFFDLAISLATWGPYSHTEIVFSDGLWFSSSPRDGGVRFKEIIPKEEHWHYHFPGASHEQEHIVRQWCESQISLPYDWLGAVGTVIPFVPHSNYRWFCSEICIAAFQSIGFMPYIIPHKTSPNKLWRLLNTPKYKRWIGSF